MKMVKQTGLYIFGAILALGGATLAPAETLRGWIADEGCARGRAHSGDYTGTNPECAKKCIAGGAKTVLIDSDHKRLLVVANPAAAKENIGDYVEIQGSVDSDAQTLNIDALTLLEKGVAKCGRKAPH